ncbi:hypothetical protein BYT27DRAFT_7209962 [Phlegmacium glaucopus]|nr:hypothetical protein BYT27DRAFT_7209962 [Phlegmacium glaucopus]
MPILKAVYFPLRFLPTPNDTEMRKASAIMLRIGSDLLKQSKASHEDDKRNKSSGRKDILSLLPQANVMQDLPEALSSSLATKQQDTHTIAMAWELYALTHTTQAQTKFRQEVSNVSTDNPTIDDLNGLPYYLDIVHELLKRMIAFLLSKAFRERNGIVRNEIRVRKGQSILVPIVLVNRDKSIWREYFTEFKLPELGSAIDFDFWKLFKLNEATIHDLRVAIPFWSARAWIGYRFSLLKIKPLLFTINRTLNKATIHNLQIVIPFVRIGRRIESNRKSLVIVLEMEIYVVSLKRVYFMLLRPRRTQKLSKRPPLLNTSPATSSFSPLVLERPGSPTSYKRVELPLSFLSINSTGSLLATSSDEGTAIRVWSIPGAEQLYQFIRGTRGTICSINFNLVSLLFSVYDTVHILKLGHCQEARQEKEQEYLLTKSLTHSMGGNLQTRLRRYGSRSEILLSYGCQPADDAPCYGDFL